MSTNREASNAEGGAVGVASGTSFVGILNLLPDEWHGVTDALVYFAPAISVGVGFFWRWARIKLAKSNLKDELTSAIETARAHRDTICLDPNSTDEHKANAQGAVEDLERLQFDALQNNYHRVEAHLTDGL